MARTFGEVREILLKTPACVGADLLLLTARINDRYQQLLNMHPWTRLLGMGTITTIASYDTGTVAVTNGSNAVTLTDGTFPSDLDQGRIRIAVDNEWYVFTRTAATTGTLDRVYEGDDATAAAYELWQPIYALPSDADIVESITVPSQQWELDEVTQEYLDETDASRVVVDAPRMWARYEDSAGGVSRIELYPGPDEAEGLPIRYRSTGSLFTVMASNATSFPDWVDTGAIIAGVEADFMLDAGNPLYQAKQAEYQVRISRMFAEDCMRMAPIELGLTDYYTQHRVARELDTDRLDRRAVLLRSF